MSLPIIAIVGRPNVGKSTLFNRLIGVRYAVTSEVAGTTRDRIYHDASFGTYNAMVVDTGGLVFDKDLKNIEADVQMQARVAIDEADLIYFVVDGTEAATTSDFDAAQLLRKTAKPVIFIIHKVDSHKISQNESELLELGFGEGVKVSSIHAIGLTELYDKTEKIFKKLKVKKEPLPSKKMIRLSIVGKPNVGKSSYVNSLLQEQRLIVSNIPGTTIDATDTPFTFSNQKFNLIDTAGLRRRGRRLGLERFGSMRSIRAIERSDITVLMLDWSSGLAKQDMHVSEYVLEAGKGLIIVVNKADLMTNQEEDQEKFLRLLSRRMDYMPWAPVIFASSVNRKNIFKILETAIKVHEERFKKVPASEFSMYTKAAIDSHPPTGEARKTRVGKGEQVDVNPPTFRFLCYEPELIHFSYKRYLENEIRRRYGFFGTVIKIEFARSKDEKRKKNY